jgi:hypothetical protein
MSAVRTAEEDPSASAPWPMMRQPQFAHRGATRLDRELEAVEDVLVPVDHEAHEVVAVLRRDERRGLLTAGRGADALQDVDDLPLTPFSTRAPL